MRLDLEVTLKTVDLVRDTAWLALRERLGWGESLLDLRRAILWRLEGEAPNAEAFRDSFSREMERSSAFYNPNKERCRWLAEGELGAGESLESVPAAADDGGGRSERDWRALLWITDEGGQQPALTAALAPPLAEAGMRLQGLRRGVLWRVDLRGPDRESARQRLADLAITRSRGHGLLANPHYQEVQLLDLAPLVSGDGA